MEGIEGKINVLIWDNETPVSVFLDMVKACKTIGAQNWRCYQIYAECNTILYHITKGSLNDYLKQNSGEKGRLYRIKKICHLFQICHEENFLIPYFEL